MQVCINEFVESNQIINKNHHGGRQKHSTMTAQTQICNNILYNKGKDWTSVVLCTDLSEAYDTGDTQILL